MIKYCKEFNKLWEDVKCACYAHNICKDEFYSIVNDIAISYAPIPSADWITAQMADVLDSFKRKPSEPII